MTRKILAVILSAGAIFGMYTQHQQIQKQSKVIKQSQQEVHDDLEYTNNELQKQKEVSRGNGRKINVELTHYTHTGNPTASGKMPQSNHTIACNFLPLNSRVRINGSVYTVEDTGAMGENVIDIFVDSEEEAIQKGRIYTTVEVL